MRLFPEKLFFLLSNNRKMKSKFLHAVPDIGYGILAMILASFLISFVRGRIESRVAGVKEKLLLARAIEERRALFLALHQDYQRLTPVIVAVEHALPRAEDALSFSGAMDALARTTGNTAVFKFDDREPVPDQELPDVAAVKFAMALNGNQNSFIKFLQGVRAIAYFSVFNDVSIRADTGLEGASQMNLNGTLYIRR